MGTKRARPDSQDLEDSAIEREHGWVHSRVDQRIQRGITRWFAEAEGHSDSPQVPPQLQSTDTRSEQLLPAAVTSHKLGLRVTELPLAQDAFQLLENEATVEVHEGSDSFSGRGDEISDSKRATVTTPQDLHGQSCGEPTEVVTSIVTSPSRTLTQRSRHRPVSEKPEDSDREDRETVYIETDLVSDRVAIQQEVAACNVQADTHQDGLADMVGQERCTSQSDIRSAKKICCTHTEPSLRQTTSYIAYEAGQRDIVAPDTVLCMTRPNTMPGGSYLTPASPAARNIGLGLDGTDSHLTLTGSPPVALGCTPSTTTTETELPAQIQGELATDRDSHKPRPVPSLRPTALKLIEQLRIHGFHGCTEEYHQQELERHNTMMADEKHHDLADLLVDGPMMDTLSRNSLLPARHVHNLGDVPEAKWRSTYCGVGTGERRPRQACLHKEEVDIVDVSMRYNIDSFGGFASSLAFANRGICFQPVPFLERDSGNSTYVDVNVGTDAGSSGRGRITPAALKDQVHFYLGYVHGAAEISVYILFPLLPTDRRKVNNMRDKDETRWLNQILLPAISNNSDPRATRHFPSNLRPTRTDSHGPQAESRQVEQQRNDDQQALRCFLPPDDLVDIWSEVVEKTSDEGFGGFIDAQIYFSATGTKLRFRSNASRPTLLQTMKGFQTYVDVLDDQFIYHDRFFIDIGKELRGEPDRVRGLDAGTADQAQVYLWKKCCLESYQRWLYDGEVPEEGQDWFNVGFLRDGCNLVSRTPRGSNLQAGGLIYSQFYSSVKEIYDAARADSFHNGGLEELCLDPTIREGAVRSTEGRCRDIDAIEAAYCDSKKRLNTSLEHSRQKRFGVEEQQRVTFVLFLEILRLLQTVEGQEEDDLLMCAPPYVWAIQTDRFVDFLAKNTEKFTTGFEVTLARCDRRYRTWEQTKMLAMFLRCACFSVGAHQLAKEPALWWGTRKRVRDSEENDGDSHVREVWHGLGFSHTIEAYGYCWLEDMFTWNEPAFSSKCTDNVLFGNNGLKRQYLDHARTARHFLSTAHRFDLALDWIARYHHDFGIRHQMIEYLIHLILQQFRVDMVHSLTDTNVMKEDGKMPLGYSSTYTLHVYLSTIMSGGCMFAQEGREPELNPVQLFNRIFGKEDNLPHPYRDDRLYRKMYHRCSVYLRDGLPDHSAYDAFKSLFPRAFFAFHWIQPYPKADDFAERTHQGTRSWYMVQLDTDEHRSDWARVKPSGWYWKKQGERTASEPKFPSFVEWNKKQWEANFRVRDPTGKPGQ